MQQPADTSQMLHIFRTGRHVATDGNAYEFSDSAVREIADTYDPQVHNAPLVIGHPKMDDPAYGGTSKVVKRGRDLYAEPKDVYPAFADLVNAHLYSGISISVYLPDSPGNPVPGKYYLRHIGFLGAVPPAVKGLRRPSFGDGDGAVEFVEPLAYVGRSLGGMFQRLRDYLISRDGLEQADAIIPQWSIADLVTTASEPPHLPPEEVMPIPAADQTAQFAEREQQLTDQAAALAAREAKIAEREQQARREGAVAFAETLVRGGQLLPRQQAPVVELLMLLPATATLEFAEGDGQVTKPAADVLRGLLAELPKQIDFAEKSAAASTADAPQFAAPPGVQVDQAQLELHQKALAWQQAHPGTDYLVAVQAVGG